MLRKILCAFAIILIATRVGYCQKVDTTLVVKHLKIRLFSELNLGLIGESTLNDYFNRELHVSFLKSKSLDEYVFIKISSQVVAIDTIADDNKILIYSTPLCLNNGEECYYVFAFNKINKKIYKLRGTNENNFLELYNSLQDKWAFWRPINKINSFTINQFTNDFWIEDLDLACLMHSLKKKKGSVCLDYFSRSL